MFGVELLQPRTARNEERSNLTGDRARQTLRALEDMSSLDEHDARLDPEGRARHPRMPKTSCRKHTASESG